MKFGGLTKYGVASSYVYHREMKWRLLAIKLNHQSETVASLTNGVMKLALLFRRILAWLTLLKREAGVSSNKCMSVKWQWRNFGAKMASIASALVISGESRSNEMKARRKPL